MTTAFNLGLTRPIASIVASSSSRAEQ